MVHRHFGVVDQVVARKGIDNHLWQHRIDQQVSVCRTAITHAVRAAHADGVEGICQIQNVGNRHLDTPDAVFNGGLIVDVVQCNGDGAAVRQIAGTAQTQRLHSLLSIKNIVLADGVNREFWRIAAQRHAVRRAAGIARGIGNGDRNAVVALTQRADDGGRDANAPTAVGLYDTGKGLAAQGNRDHVARCRAARLAGDNLRLALLAGIENIVARYGIDRNYGCGGINGEIGGG
ncbi:hypothetical protein CIP106467_1677 [Citrobacter europaeus]|nr:hypothetical protein TUM12147_26460 [Citrobacter europaeus]CAD7561589.1 hypothetical protein CIP106467_1677 [Citrobacter europaeus]